MTRRRNRRRGNSSRNYTPILIDINQEVNFEGPGTSSSIIPLVSNELDGFSNLTVKNFTTNLIAEIPSNTTGAANLEQIGYYIMFIPEGYSPAVNFPFIHPEWILNYSYVGTPLPDTQPVGFNIRKSSRRTRKLKPGDKIVLFVLGTNTNSGSGIISFNGLVKFLSKRN